MDPEAAERLHPADEKRILRALEVYRETGKTISAHNAETRDLPPRYDAVWIGLQFEERAEMNTILVAYADGTGQTESDAVSADLMAMDGVASYSYIATIRDSFTDSMNAINYAVVIIILAAAALAFVVLYNLTNINITERVREIATIKVLGFYPSETNAYVFRENIVLTAIAALVGMPVGKWFHTFVMNEIQVDLLSFDVHVEPRSYLLALVMTFAFALIVNCAMYFRLNKINMAESLKSIE